MEQRALLTGLSAEAIHAGFVSAVPVAALLRFVPVSEQFLSS